MGSSSEKTVTGKTAWIYGFAVLFLIACATSASAITFRLGGPDGAGIDFDNAAALYGSSYNGHPVLLAEIGGPAPDGATFTDIGVPSLSPDGKVVFGAEETGFDGTPHWRVFVGDPAAPQGRRISRAFDDAAMSDRCIPWFKTDPYPVAGNDGSIVFLAPEKGAKDALFRYQSGKLECVARIGDRTAQGHRIELLYFGSAQVSRDGTLALEARLDGAARDAKPALKTALLLKGPGSQLSEVAVEGDRAPGGGRFGSHFGPPALIASSAGAVVAFVDRTSTGTALFTHTGGHTFRAIQPGIETELGKLTYISDGRPGLRADGTVAVRAACKAVTAVFVVRAGEPVLVARQGSTTAFGTHLKSFTDPSLTAQGRVFVAGRDETDFERLFIFDGPESGGELREIAWKQINDRAPRLFPGSLVVNTRGDYAYLGEKKGLESNESRELVSRINP